MLCGDGIKLESATYLSLSLSLPLSYLFPHLSPHYLSPIIFLFSSQQTPHIQGADVWAPRGCPFSVSLAMWGQGCQPIGLHCLNPARLQCVGVM